MGDYSVTIGIDAEIGKLDAIEAQINKLCSGSHRIPISFDTKGIESQIKTIESQIKSLNNTPISPGSGGSGGRGGSRRGSNEIKDIYDSAVYYQRKINSIKTQMAKTDPDKNPIKYNALSKQLSNYTKEFDKANESFDVFSAKQRRQLQRLQAEGENQVKLARSGLADSVAKEFETAAARTDAQTDAMIQKSRSKIESIRKSLTNGDIDNKIGELESRRRKIGTSNQTIDDALGTKDTVGRIQSLKKSISDAFSDGSAFSPANMGNVISQFEQMNSAIAQTDNGLKQLKRDNPVQQKGLSDTVAAGIQKKLMTGDIENRLSTLMNQFSKLGSDDSGIANNLQRMQTLLSDMGNANGVDDLISKYKEFNTLASKTKDQIKGIKDAQDLAFAKKNLSNDIDTWLNKNTAAAGKFGAQLRDIQKQIESADGAKLNNLSKQFTSIKKEASALGMTGLSLSDQMKDAFAKLFPYMNAAWMMRQGIQAVKQMAQETIAVDKAMTELYRVTNLSDAQYSQLYQNMTESAKNYGTELDTMINATASWVRLGFDANTANKLAEVSAMYQNVTDLDETTAVKNLVTAYQGYKDQLLTLTGNDQVAAVEMVADIFDKLGNELPVTAAQVGAGLNKWASVAQSAGATIQEAAAMTVGSGSVTQDFEQAGSALKIATLRIRGKFSCPSTLKRVVHVYLSNVA